MKVKIAPWKIKARDVLLESAKRWRPHFIWDCSPVQRLGDYVTLSISNGTITAYADLSLRLIWKGGQRGDFAYSTTLIRRLAEDFLDKCEAASNSDAAAAQAWNDNVTPKAAQEKIA